MPPVSAGHRVLPAYQRGRNVLAAAASGIRDQVNRDGGDPDEVLSRAGISWANLTDKKNALDLGAYVAMMEIAARHTGNDNFGLQYGQRFTPRMLGLIGEVVLTAPNLGAALSSLASLFPYHQQATETRLVREGHLLRLEYRILDGRIVDRRQDAELTLACSPTWSAPAWAQTGRPRMCCASIPVRTIGATMSGCSTRRCISGSAPMRWCCARAISTPSCPRRICSASLCCRRSW